MARAIPLKLLVHECTLKHKTGLDRNRNPTYSSTVLKRVRIGATLQIMRGQAGETKADTMTLFIDAVNTQYKTPAGEATTQTLPEELDVITWNGNDYTVRSITPCYAQGATPQHWEITLE